jgi:hypothetical protein
MTLANGVYVQVYCDSLPGDGSARLDGFARSCAMLADVGVLGVFPHLFPDTIAPFGDYARAARSEGLSVGGALGLDESKVTPDVKGHALAEVATTNGSIGVLWDAEGHYDPGRDRATEMQVMGTKFRALAPDAFCVAQPWPEPAEHGSFPYAIENSFVNVSAPQYYVNDWKSQYGRARYATLLPVFDAQWAKLDATFQNPPVRFPTWQGAGWDDIVADCGDVMVTRPKVILWCEPWPSTVALRQIRARKFLVQHGYIGPNWENAPQAVVNFQRAYNVHASAPIAEDGRCGNETLGAMGV